MTYIFKSFVKNLDDFKQEVEALINTFSNQLTQGERDNLFSIYDTSYPKSLVPVSEISAFLSEITTVLTDTEKQSLESLTKTMPTELPLSLDETKSFLEIVGDLSPYKENELLQNISTARYFAESYIGIDLIKKIYTKYLDHFPYYNNCGIEIGKVRLNSINYIKYTINKVKEELSSDDYYFTRQDKKNSSIYLYENKEYPETDKERQSVEIEFNAGLFTNSLEVSSEYKTALLNATLMIRENVGDCANDMELTSKLSKLFAPYSTIPLVVGV